MTPDLICTRDVFTTKMSLGQLFWKGSPLLINEKKIYTGEDVARPDGIKIYKETAIPAGDYFIQMTMSTRFKKILPLIYNHADLSVVSEKKIWTGVRQHNGNTEDHTEGCQLMGLGRNDGGVYSSHNCMIIYLPWITEAVKAAGGILPFSIINDQA